KAREEPPSSVLHCGATPARRRGGRVSAPILTLEGVSKRFIVPLDLAARAANLLGAGLRETVVHALADVTFSVAEGEVVGLVGESGCGKSTLGRIIAGILAPSAGEVHFRGAPLAAAMTVGRGGRARRGSRGGPALPTVL